MRLAIQRRVNARERRLRVLPVILPGGQRAKESDVPGFLQGTTWVKFEKSIKEEDALYRLECGIRGIPPGRRPGEAIQVGALTDTSLAGNAVLVTTIIAGGFFWTSKRELAREADVSRRFAQQSSQSDFLLASLYARDDPRRALAHLARALRSNPDNHAAERLGWFLSISTPFSLAAFPHESGVTSAISVPTARGWSPLPRTRRRGVDARSGQPLTEPLKHEDLSGRRVSVPTARGSSPLLDKTARVWDARSGRPLTKPLTHEPYRLLSEFQSRRHRASSPLPRTRRRVCGTRAAASPSPSPSDTRIRSASASFSPDGTRVVTASADKRRVCGTRAAASPSPSPLNTMLPSLSEFQADGTRVVTAPRTRRRGCGTRAAASPSPSPSNTNASVTLSELQLPTARGLSPLRGDMTARVWDARSGQPLTEPLTHDACGQLSELQCRRHAGGHRFVGHEGACVGRAQRPAPHRAPHTRTDRLLGEFQCPTARG